jgi:hypothetical protein
MSHEKPFKKNHSGGDWSSWVSGKNFFIQPDFSPLSRHLLLDFFDSGWGGLRLKLVVPFRVRVSFGCEVGNLAAHELTEEGDCEIQVAVAGTVDHAFVDQCGAAGTRAADFDLEQFGKIQRTLEVHSLGIP